MKRLVRYVMAMLVAVLAWSCSSRQTVALQYPDDASNRMKFAAEHLTAGLESKGFNVVPATEAGEGVKIIRLSEATDSVGPKEGFTITTVDNIIDVRGNDGSGVIYGCRELIDRVEMDGNLDNLPSNITDAPEMVLRGACVGVQKPYLLPGRSVYEYPYTPENFPWFYDKELWIKYLDMLVENRMNSLYLWNGHPFASLVKLEDYPFAVEVDDETFKKNEEMFSFLTTEADKRGIFVIQMFYNILLSKPFAEHYGMKTQDRNRPITPLVSDYTRKSVAAFIEKYPNVGLLVCLGEAMDTYEDDVVWFTETIIPGVKDGLAKLGRTDEPPLLLRAHDTDCKAVMDAALPLYKNLYTMHKYNGESLTTYEPRGPWTEIHRSLSSLGSVHISNVHILANLEPWRWSSPDFIQKAVTAMHDVHGANALHLYPQASYWDWPYSADSIAGGGRELQLVRDSTWYEGWGRYAWNCRRDRQDEIKYWNHRFARTYGLGNDKGADIREAFEESGEIAPKLLRRFGITEGNRQTLLLGMFMSQLVNPYKYTIYPGFYESCGPEGEKLIEFVEKEHKGEPHVGELPLDITAQCVAHGDKAVEAIKRVGGKVNANSEEFERLSNDMECYRLFAYAFDRKVKAAQKVLDYQWTKDLSNLDAAVPLMEESLDYYKQLVDRTKGTYRYANSMQTTMRRIPIAGDDGKNKTWEEMLVHYQAELDNFKNNLATLKDKAAGKISDKPAEIKPLADANVKVNGPWKRVKLAEGASLLENMPDATVAGIAPELEGLTAFRVNGDNQRKDGTELTFENAEPVKLLVAYFKDDQKKYAKAPKLETDATANEYGQAEPVLTSAIHLDKMPLANIHAYSFAPGKHSLNLPKGYALVLGFTSDNITPRNAALAGEDEAMDWLFY
ncbi:glycoside hydrolase family 20 zincin-like fold domain-containing protein [uncultured Duncaniella sp.]|uniref:alpha-d-galacturonidase n=4 Tax=uncultured Duncaniella sp. TaxID=2768039 RepID=UPI00351DA906